VPLHPEQVSFANGAAELPTDTKAGTPRAWVDYFARWNTTNEQAAKMGFPVIQQVADVYGAPLLHYPEAAGGSWGECLCVRVCVYVVVGPIGIYTYITLYVYKYI